MNNTDPNYYFNNTIFFGIQLGIYFRLVYLSNSNYYLYLLSIFNIDKFFKSLLQRIFSLCSGVADLLNTRWEGKWTLFPNTHPSTKTTNE